MSFVEKVVLTCPPPITVLDLWPTILSFLDYWEHVHLLSSDLLFRSWFTEVEIETMRKLWVKALITKATDRDGVERVYLCGRWHRGIGPVVKEEDGSRVMCLSYNVTMKELISLPANLFDMGYYYDWENIIYVNVAPRSW